MSMQITNQADYAFRAMLYLAKLEPGQQAASNIIAEEMKMSRLFLSRINSQLSNAGLIITRRGARGGIALARSASDISVYEVLSAVDGPIKFMNCERDHSECVFWNGHCPLKCYWEETEKILIERLQSTSLQDILDCNKEAA